MARTRCLRLFLVICPSLYLAFPSIAAAAAPGGDLPGSVSGATVVVSAEAADDVAVAGVQFLLDGEPFGPEDRVAPYSTVWDTTVVPDGIHGIAARARDTAGNESTSAVVEVLVDNLPDPDTSPPGVRISSPVAGSTLEGTVSVAAAAGDDVGVVGVEFFLDGRSLGPEDTSYPWGLSWDTTTVADGTHSIAARARDAAGNSAVSAPVSVDVANSAPDTSPPRVVATSPDDGSTLAGVVTLKAEATDDTRVAGVQFAVDGTPIGPVLGSAPYTLSWDTASIGAGDHIIVVAAWDDAGNESASAPVRVVVGNADAKPDAETRDLAPSQLDATIERMSSGDAILVTAGTRVEGVERVALRIDRHDVVEVRGNTLEYTWDTRPLVGFHELEVLGYGGDGDMLGSVSVYQIEVEPASAPGRRRHGSDDSVTTTAMVLSVELGPQPGEASILAASALDGVWSIELYIDGERVAMTRRGKPVDFRWTPEPGGHEVVVSVSDRTGVVAAASATVGW